MTDIERRLEQAYAASDVLLADWDTDHDLVTPLRARSRPVAWYRSPRALYPLLSAAAIAVVVIGTVSFGQHASDRSTSPGNPASTPAVSTPNQQAPSTAVARAAANAKVLERLIPDLRNVTVESSTRGAAVTAEYWPGGQHLANLVLWTGANAYSYSPASEGGNPCTLQAGDTPGRQGAPAPDDQCASFPQADGTVVWIRREGHSPSRPWTTANTRQWDVTHHNLDGARVALQVTSDISELNSSVTLQATVPFDIPDAALIAVVTSPDIAIEPPCNRSCRMLPPAPGATVAPAPNQSS